MTFIVKMLSRLQLTFIAFVFYIGASAGMGVGAYFVHQQILKCTTCNITAILNPDCSTSPSGVIHLTQYVQVDYNYTGKIDCGSVGFCDHAACLHPVALFQIYPCCPEGDIYRIHAGPTGWQIMFSLIIVAAILCPIVCTYLFYRILGPGPVKQNDVESPLDVRIDNSGSSGNSTPVELSGDSGKTPA